jgi:alanyl-tRNA synthetase
MRTKDIRKRYLSFFLTSPRNHVEIRPAPLVLENDPTTLFTSSGMQPLVPYLLGQPHTEGTRLTDSQPCVRTQDIEEVGDNRHLTYFEMLGNWSLGDYFKDDQLPQIFEFLTDEKSGIGLDPRRIYVSVFEGNEEVEKDFTSIGLWKEIYNSRGIPAEEALTLDITKVNKDARIFAYPAKKNWWSRSGPPEKMPAGEIGGPDSEMFYDLGAELKLHEVSLFKDEACHPNCDCGRFIEIGNSVFIQYKKSEDGSLLELPQKNVDFGGGLERIAMAVNNQEDVFMLDLFQKFIRPIEQKYDVTYLASIETDKSIRILADHLRAAIMLISTGVYPSNKESGYVLRRLIRRAVFHASLLNNGQVERDMLPQIDDLNEDEYPIKVLSWPEIKSVLEDEVGKFEKTLATGLLKLHKFLYDKKTIDGKTAFDLYQTDGFPFELTEEILRKEGGILEDNAWSDFDMEFEKHKDLSRTSAAGMFKGGLADQSEDTTKLHTVAHLLQASLRHVLGEHVGQKGQHITGERLRFDFSHMAKLTDDQVSEVETMINEAITQDLPISKEEIEKQTAVKNGALGFFLDRYPDIVSVYTIGGPSTNRSGQPSGEDWFSKEICGGPHVTHTGVIGRVRINKQEKIGNGVIRLYLVLDETSLPESK